MICLLPRPLRKRQQGRHPPRKLTRRNKVHDPNCLRTPSRSTWNHSPKALVVAVVAAMMAEVRAAVMMMKESSATKTEVNARSAVIIVWARFIGPSDSRSIFAHIF
jgi:hypothetical protein